MDELIRMAPVAVIRLTEDDRVAATNQSAVALGLTTGLCLNECISGIEESFYQLITREMSPRTWAFRLGDRDKRFRVAPARQADGLYLWLQDQTELAGLAEKLRKQSSPESRLLRQVNHQAVTAMGYTELLDVITDDHEMISGDKLSAVRQYLKDISGALRVIQQVASRENTHSIDSQSTVLVVDGHAALSELISELLRAEGYKAVSFSDPASALKYFTVNHHAVQKAVIDESLKAQSSSLITELRTVSPDLNIVTLTDRENSAVPHSVMKPLDFQLLLRAVEGVD